MVKDGEENGAGIVTWAPLDIKISKRGDTSGIAENSSIQSVKRKQAKMRQTDNRRVGNNKLFYETVIISNTTRYHHLEK